MKDRLLELDELGKDENHTRGESGATRSWIFRVAPASALGEEAAVRRSCSRSLGGCAKQGLPLFAGNERSDPRPQRAAETSYKFLRLDDLAIA